MKYALFILSLGVLLSCSKNESLPGIKKIGHGGMGLYGDYPMNSYESLMQTLILGADGTEMDIQMTRDSVLVLFHDADLTHKTTGNGAIHEHTWDALKNVKYDEIALGRYDLIRLDFFLEHCNSYTNKEFRFDVKSNAPDEEHLYCLNRTLSDLITKYNLQNHCTIEFQTKSQIEHLISLRTDLEIYSYTDFETSKNLISTYQLAGWVAKKDDINQSRVDQIHQLCGAVVGFSTFNKQAHLDLIHMGVDAIETDDVKGLLKLYK